MGGCPIVIFSFLLTRCLVESRWERSVSSFIHGGKYLKVAKKTTIDTNKREDTFVEFKHLAVVIGRDCEEEG